MEFSNPTNRAKGILQDINFLCGTTTATYPLADIVRNVNVAYLDVTRLIWESADGWQFDDSNNSDLPIATRTLTHNTQSIQIPSTARKIERIEVKDKGGTFQLLKQIDLRDINVATTNYLTPGGMPIYYDLRGNFIDFYPSPLSGSVTLTSGMKVYLNRDVTLFTTASTTAAPGFVPSFHRILSYSAAIDFTQDNSQKNYWLAQKQNLVQGLIKFYGSRNVELPKKIQPLLKKFRNTYK